MAAPARSHSRLRAVLLAALVAIPAVPGTAQVLPWEITLAEIEAGRLRGLAERLSKQNLLYQLHLGNERKDDILATVERVDRILESLGSGSPSYSIPEPWTPEIRAQREKVDGLWGPIRRIAVANPYDYLRVSRQFAPQGAQRVDPLLLRHFDTLTTEFIEEAEKLIALYDRECQATGLAVCETARTSGYAAMVIERAAKQAVYIVAGIDEKEQRAALEQTIRDYQALRKRNDASDFFAAALDPERGASAAAARELLVSLRVDWDAMQQEFTMLAAGDPENFELQRLLETQTRLVAKVERLTSALIRYASLTYGS